MKKIRVLIVDDSALMRQILSTILAGDPELEVVGTASDPIAARAKIRDLAPDVLTLDVEMPKMDGLSFLEELMRRHPMPVVMVSSLTERGCEVTLRALEAGACDFVTKPKIDLARGTADIGAEIVAKVKVAARSRIRARAPGTRVVEAKPAHAPSAVSFRTTQRFIAIGASTGGTEALRDVLTALPADAPPIVIVQHMPPVFTRQFAQRLDGICKVQVREAKSGDALVQGHVLIAPGGDWHMEVVRSGANYGVRLVDAPPVGHHRPSVNILFESCARTAGANAVGVILTGMGNDGARGMLAMHRAGSVTLAEDESTCVVFGMPKEAIACGAVDHVVPLDRMAASMLRAAAETVSRKAIEERR
jgi:two-component system chemotaxis response regulator CheB